MCPRLDWMNMRSFFEAISVSCVIPAQSPADDERTVFENLSFAVERGEIVDLVGPSGSGKSSLLTACARLNPHAHGAFALEGKGSGEFTPQQWRRDVAYLPQKPILTGKNVAEAIRLPWTLAIRGKGGKGEHLLPDERIRTTLDAMGCEDIDLERAPHDLSGGQAARVALARTLLTDPKVLLADEVDAGLDDDNAAKVATIMADAAAHGMAIIRIRHRPPDGRATRTLTLDKGRLIRSNSVWMVFALMAVMLVAAVQIVMSRARGIPKGLAGPIFLSLVITMLLMLALVTELIVRPHPWYAPQLVVPLTGMLLGNTVTALAVGLSRFYESMEERRDEVDMMLALGATPWESARPSIVSSIRLGLLPTTASLASSGIVTIPGMMAGQVIAGGDPLNAAKYQFVVLDAIAALTLLADGLIMVMIYRTSFTADDQYRPPEAR